MKRTIVHIDEERCSGCGACARACHEGAIAMVGGKARLIRDDYCDGLGDCLPACPAGAISFEEREAVAYDEAAVAEHLAARSVAGEATGGPLVVAPATPHAGGCPGSAPRALRPAGAMVVTGAPFAPVDKPVEMPGALMPASPFAPVAPSVVAGASGVPAASVEPSQLAQWPCQIKLAPPRAPYFQGCELLVAADCTAFAYASLHRDFMAGRVTLIGCPKLDAVDYAVKLGVILRDNDVRSVTVLRMEVPCCGGLASAVGRAVAASGKDIPLHTVTISCDGRLLG